METGSTPKRGNVESWINQQIAATCHKILCKDRFTFRFLALFASITHRHTENHFAAAKIKSQKQNQKKFLFAETQNNTTQRNFERDPSPHTERARKSRSMRPLRAAAYTCIYVHKKVFWYFFFFCCVILYCQALRYNSTKSPPFPKKKRILKISEWNAPYYAFISSKNGFASSDCHQRTIRIVFDPIILFEII